MNMQDQLRAAMLAAQSASTISDVQSANALSDKAIDDVINDRLDTSLTPSHFGILDDKPEDYDTAVTAPVDLSTPVDVTSVVSAPGNATSTSEQTLDDVPAVVPEPVNTLTREKVQIKNLDEKAVLVHVKRRMYSPYKLDTEESKAYGAGNVNKHLFEGRNNRVKEAISKYSDVYVYVKDNTVPWSTGVEMLNMMHYMDFTSGLRNLIDEANQAVKDLYNHWDAEVVADLARLAAIAASKGKPNLANPSDYPTADEILTRFSIEVRYQPVPTADGFDPRLGISDDDKATVQQQLDDAGSNATTHVLQQMMEPMRRAVDKLKVNIGNDGAIFRDSLIDNMVDVADRMRRINLSDDPQITESIKDLQSLVSTYANNKEMLRNAPTVRAKAATQIDDLVNKMAGLV
jgi:hypothetical protein